MKKLITFALILSAPLALSAQEVAQLPGGLYIDRGLFTGIASILVLYLISAFIISIIKLFQEYRLKSKLIEKGVSEAVVEQFLQPTKKDSRTQAIKWFLILAAVGLGLTIVQFTLPLGFHSVAIMSFCIAFSFLGYYYYIKMSEK
jgi:hypothetical protein